MMQTNKKSSLAESLRNRLSKTRQVLTQGLGGWFKHVEIDEARLEELEDTLIAADIGVHASQQLVDRLRNSVNDKKRGDPGLLLPVLRDEMLRILEPCTTPLPMIRKPWVILMVGVNGVGKTTTTAKIAKRFKDQNKSVMLAAADTFRAAAVEQLQNWGDRLDIPVIAQHQDADAAAVAHDALISARTRNFDVLMVDTAGRQHTHGGLMEQLKKIRRVLNKIDADAPHEVMQVLDAGTGQNALSQLRHFDDAVNVSSLCLTKLDGTAKGGVLLAIAQQFPRPVRFLGVGESFDDLRPFDAPEFVDALLPDPS